MTLDDAGLTGNKFQTFHPSHHYVGGIIDGYSQYAHTNVIKNEEMVFSAEVNYAEKYGGVLTKLFINALRDNGLSDALPKMIFDSRVHMLMDGWFPCIPGWHIDDFYRSPDTGQPDLRNVPNQRHYMMLFGNVAYTQFLRDSVSLVDPLPGERLYDSYNRQINRKLACKEVSYESVTPGRLLSFGNSDLHRGVAAQGSGWRFFIRASLGSSRMVTNETRMQTQVYLPVPEAGW